MKLYKFDADDLIMSATSHYLGRRTAMVSEHCDALVKSWPKLSQAVRDYVRRIVESAFERDDHCRSLPDFGFALPLGNDCDREAWLRVRALWVDSQRRETSATE